VIEDEKLVPQLDDAGRCLSGRRRSEGLPSLRQASNSAAFTVCSVMQVSFIAQ